MVGRGSERAGRGMWPAVLSSRAAEVVVRAWRPRSTRIITAGYALGLSDALVSFLNARRNLPSCNRVLEGAIKGAPTNRSLWMVAAFLRVLINS